jgi:fructoselysine transporter
MKTTETLQRKIGLVQATAINMIDMVGIGPFVTIYLVIGFLPGPYFLYAWFAGALLSWMDAMVWSELGAAYPKAGGSYNFLKIAYGEKKWGKLFSFLYVWQTMIQAPLVIASASIGFSEYLNYIFPLTDFAAKAVSGAVVILVVVLLYRKIEAIGKISVLMWICVFIVFLWIISGAIMHGNMMQPMRDLNNDFSLNILFSFAFGQAMGKSMYAFLGYYNVCHLGGEIINPQKNIPRSMMLSVAGITVLYLLLNISITSVIPWQEAMKPENKYIASLYIRQLFGNTAAVVATVLILIVAVSSVFSATLGYTRIPYAAAKDNAFFSVFARLHPEKGFPHIALLTLGAIAFVFSLLFRMRDVISGILAMRILIQFVAQSFGLILLRRRFGTTHLSYKMPAYPLPVIISVTIWLFILYTTGQFALWGLGFILLGCGAFYLAEKYNLFKAPGTKP